MFKRLLPACCVPCEAVESKIYDDNGDYVYIDGECDPKCPEPCEECELTYFGPQCYYCDGDLTRVCCDGTCCQPGEECCEDKTCYDPATEQCCGQGTGHTCPKDETCCGDNCCDPANQCCVDGQCKSCCKDSTTGNCEAHNSDCGCAAIGPGGCTDNIKEWTLGSTHFCYSECEGWPCNYTLTEVNCYAWQACKNGAWHVDSVCEGTSYCQWTIVGFCQECIPDPDIGVEVVEAYDCRCP